MKKKYGFSIFGTDLRQKELYHLLYSGGYRVSYNSENEIYNNVILPIRPDRDYSSMIDSLKGSKIFLGRKDIWFQLYPHLEKEKVFDYTDDESFKIYNAYLTGEGAVSVAIDNSQRSLINSRVLILGAGRIGIALAQMLLSFTKDITVSSRKISDKAKVISMGLKSANTEKLPSLSDFDYIFNTVPAKILSDEKLLEIKDALLIDLASIDCANIKLCKELNINVIKALGLPGKYSPKSASIILKNTILHTLEEDML
ncbi:MAG: NAD(P)-dependent oxidoreductase [Acutalibacteraceae bacterium]